MSKLLGWAGGFINRFKGYIILVIIIGTLVGTIWFMHNKIESLNIKVGQYEASITSYEAAEQKWQKRTKEQNESIDNLQETERRMRELLKEADRQRELRQRKFEERIRQLAEETVPKSCEGAMDYLWDKAQEHAKD